MYPIFWKTLIALSIVVVIEAGVKIEISRLKDPPSSVASLPNVKGNNTNENDTTETTTTMITTTEITTKLPTKASIESIVLKLANSNYNTNNSSIDTTTVASQNVTPSSPSLVNNTNTTPNKIINKNTSVAYNVTLHGAKDLSQYLSEFTRRKMRRRLSPPGYYCPCDLKVLCKKKISNISISSHFLTNYSIQNVDQFL